MSLLSQARKPSNSNIIMTISGDPGLGKSTMACTFPKPFVIDIDEGLQRVPEQTRAEGLIVDNFDTLRRLLKELMEDEHDYKTLVIDTVTSLDAMITSEIIKDSGVSSINQAAGGYGAGPKAVAARHEAFAGFCRKVAKERNMHLVFIAHSDTETIQLVDREEAYMRYSFRMPKLSMRPYLDQVDLIGFIRHELFLKSKAKDASVKRATGSGDRLFDCSSNVWSVAKNALGINEPIVVEEGVNPLTPYFNF